MVVVTGHLKCSSCNQGPEWLIFLSFNYLNRNTWLVATTQDSTDQGSSPGRPGKLSAGCAVAP